MDQQIEAERNLSLIVWLGDQVGIETECIFTDKHSDFFAMKKWDVLCALSTALKATATWPRKQSKFGDITRARDDYEQT